MGEGSGRGSGRVRVGNRGSGRVNVSPGRVGSGPMKSDPWTTLHCMSACAVKISSTAGQILCT